MRDSKEICDSLDRWLEVATRGLVESSVEQVREEVQAHVDEAVDEAVRGGMDSRIALADTIAQLGNPKSANREYRKNLLTKNEESRIRELYRLANPRYTFKFVFGVSCFFIFIFYYNWKTRSPEIFRDLMVLEAIIIGAGILLFLLQKYVKRLKWLKKAGPVYFMLALVLSQVLIHKAHPSSTSFVFTGFLLTFCLLVGALQSNIDDRIKKKIPKAQWPIPYREDQED